MPCFFRLCHIFFFFRFCHIFYLFRPQKPRLGFAASTTSHCTFEALPPAYLNVFGSNPHPLGFNWQEPAPIPRIPPIPEVWVAPLARWVLVWSCSPLSLLSLPVEKHPANGTEPGNPTSSVGRVGMPGKKSMFWDAGPALGLPECRRHPWNHLGMAAPFPGQLSPSF